MRWILFSLFWPSKTQARMSNCNSVPPQGGHDCGCAEEVLISIPPAKTSSISGVYGAGGSSNLPRMRSFAPACKHILNALPVLFSMPPLWTCCRLRYACCRLIYGHPLMGCHKCESGHDTNIDLPFIHHKVMSSGSPSRVREHEARSKSSYKSDPRGSKGVVESAPS